MSKINRLTVVLTDDFTDAGAEVIVNAIGMVKGVHTVVPEVIDYVEAFVCETRVKHELIQKLLEVLR